jgi:hypothetical protein
MMNMRMLSLLSGTLLLFAAAIPAYGQGVPENDLGWTTIPLEDLGAFENPGGNWTLAADAWADYTQKGTLEQTKEGKGVVINHPAQKHRSQLVTKQQFGDIEMALDFMMAKESNSGVYLQGKYEVQLLDSWTKQDPASGDCGGIYQRWDNSRPAGHKGYEGIPPLQNACRAPGLWQHLVIKFRAPRFDAQGNKIANARFEEVYLNGVLVQSQVEVTGPTRSPSTSTEEKSRGPLLLQGDHGQVAFRNIRYRPLNIIPVKPSNKAPIIVTPGEHPYLLRSFMEFGGKKLTYVISMGDQSGLNYSYDLRTGALFQLWRGRFVDAADMWHSRGMAQLALPLGSLVPLSDAPAIAALRDQHEPWPDSVAFDDFRDEGYELDKERIPTYSYVIEGTAVKDRIAPAAGRAGFVRTITVTNPPADLYSRVIAGSTIEQLDKELYRVNGNCYLLIDRRYKPQIRPTKAGQEMLVSLADQKDPLTYSIIW